MKLASELKNAQLENLATPPTNPSIGRIYNDTNLVTPRIWTGNAWVSLDASKLAPSSVPLSVLAIDPLSRTNHTGLQNPATISGFDNQVRTSRLDQMASPTAPISLNGQKITSLADPSLATDAVTKQYTDNALQNAIAGIDQKASCRAVASANIILSGLQTIDSVSLNLSDRVLVTGQTDATQNGFYSVMSGAWIRTTDADANSEVTPGAFTFIEEGTVYGKTQWRLNTTGNIVLGTTALLFQQFGAAQYYINGNGLDLTGNIFSAKTPFGSGILVDATGIKADFTTLARKFSLLIGDGTATSFTVTHNLNTQDINITAREVASPYAIVYPDFEATTVNTATIRFSNPPAVNSYKVIVLG